jgi:uncharacterized protein involved in outer membrane biogenesis
VLIIEARTAAAHTRHMFRLIKWVLIIVLVFVAVAVGLVLSRDRIAKTAMEQQIRSQTGMDVKIGSLKTSVLSPIATIQNLTLYNTADFGGTPFLHIKELHMEFDREALAHREMKFKLFKLNVAELSVVKNDLGHTNIVTMMANAKIKPPTGAVEFKGIEVANFSVGKISFLDLKEQRNNRVRQVNLQNQVFRNVNTAGDLYGVLVLMWARSGGG